MNVGIVGLGLIGGSLALDLTRAGYRVTGHDRDPDSVGAAIDAGAIQAELGHDLGDDPAALDLIVIAVPVRSALTVVRRLGERIPEDAGTVVTDVGSTKVSVVAAAVDAGLARRFVGGHPMAGDDRSGWSAARPGLFRDAGVWLCAAPGADDHAVGRVEDVWTAVGGRTRRIDAAAHDRRMALVSHLPQVAASALAAVLADGGAASEDMGPGGRDATRLAGSDPEMWSDILLDNGREILPAITALIERLRALEQGMEAADEAAVRGWLEAGRSFALLP